MKGFIEALALAARLNAESQRLALKIDAANTRISEARASGTKVEQSFVMELYKDRGALVDADREAVQANCDLERALIQDPAGVQLALAAAELLASLDPDTLEAVADEITDDELPKKSRRFLPSFHHSARAASLRGVAKRQRVALSKAIFPTR